MNGGHDLGGMHGLGPINPIPEHLDTLFHDDWERRVFAITLACGFLGQWNLDESRFARENQHPGAYLSSSYYEIWLNGLKTLLLEKGLITEAELEGKRVALVNHPDKTPLAADKVNAVLRKGGPVSMEADDRPAFSVGDSVRVKNFNPEGHTRAPRYVRGHGGQVREYHGCHVFPDANSRGERRGEHLYSVAFTATELWGDDARGDDCVCVDLWQSYLICSARSSRHLTSDAG